MSSDPTMVMPNQPPPGGQGAQDARRTRRPHRGRRITVRVIIAVIVLAVVFAIGVPIYAWTRITKVDATPAGSRPADTPGTTYLLVGSDSRAGLTAAERHELATGNAGGQRTDTIMLLHVPKSGKPVLISIPRDSYVPIPGHGKNKINAAYAFGGPKLLTQTVEQATGLRIDDYVEIGFGGFVSVIDSLGGIRMCLPTAIKDKDSGINLAKGCQTLNGKNALGYVRERHQDARGDLGRVERQRAMLAAVAKKAASPASVINPVRYFSMATSTAKALSVGKGTGPMAMIRFARAMQKVSGGDGVTMTVPVADANYQTPAGDSVKWDSDKALALFHAIARDDTSGLHSS